MLNKKKSLLLACVAILLSLNVVAQVGEQPAVQQPAELPGSDSLSVRSSISASDVQRLREIAAFQNQLDNDNSKSAEKIKAETNQRVTEELKQLNLPCQMEQAKLLGYTGEKNKKLASYLYEVACTNGMGYVMLTSPNQKTFVSSCFEADAIKKANSASVAESPYYCQLQTQSDLNISAQKIIAQQGGECAPISVQWYGRSAEFFEEYTEVSCSNNKGYLIVSGTEKSVAQPKIMDCVSAAKQGFVCKMTATKVISVMDLSQGLAAHGLACAPEKIRVFGKEKVRKRHVVEAICSGQTKSLIAFLPMEEGAAAYETMSCEEGASAGIKCNLAP